MTPPVSTASTLPTLPLLHRLRNLFLRTFLRFLRLFSPPLSKLLTRISLSPGLPVPLPSHSPSYWLTPPSPLAQHNASYPGWSERYADVVVIGSGITGTSVVRTLLDWDREQGGAGEGGETLQVVMLEARDTCSGATGRNGGHVTPILYADYPGLREQHGAHIAKQIMRFRLAHLPAFLELAASDGLREGVLDTSQASDGEGLSQASEDLSLPESASQAHRQSLLDTSQARSVDTFDVFLGPKLFRNALSALEVYRRDMGSEAGWWRIWDFERGAEKVEELQLSKKTVGALSTRAGAVQPYRLVTGVLERLVEEYDKYAFPSPFAPRILLTPPTYPSFELFTQTPCTHITTPSSSPQTQTLYKVHTPKGPILTPHIVHATNGWAAHLLPGMRGKIVPARGTMSAQVGWRGLGDGVEVRDESGKGKREAEGPAVRPFESASGTKPVQTENAKSWAGTRSFVLFPTDEPHVYDYLTQQRVGALSAISSDAPASTTTRGHYPDPEGEFMLGGGFEGPALLREFGNADDTTYDEETGRYLGAALMGYFDTGRGAKEDVGGAKGEKRDKATVKATWGGILGISVDGKPWVGRVPSSVSGRPAPAAVSAEGAEMKRARGLAAPGEWMAAGYTGEGMVHAWMSGRALAYMVLGLDGETAGGVPGEKAGEWKTEKENASKEKEAENNPPEVGSVDVASWLPSVYRISEERWRSAEIEDLFAAFVMS
ncbi:hypothetical protein DXG03_007889 [Asterophora parasitica]|uniref:FAD dependent oxidoreductase domain-containing protein n=1 Tax=Asterophora parasitica TaxID=117018 RepID=A0A9P7FYY8_9AGAR|nr:hypothetical protein DXG03_007889 [Asterophora parasitica]